MPLCPAGDVCFHPVRPTGYIDECPLQWSGHLPRIIPGSAASRRALVQRLTSPVRLIAWMLCSLHHVISGYGPGSSRWSSAVAGVCSKLHCLLLLPVNGVANTVAATIHWLSWLVLVLPQHLLITVSAVLAASILAPWVLALACADYLQLHKSHCCSSKPGCCAAHEHAAQSTAEQCDDVHEEGCMSRAEPRTTAQQWRQTCTAVLAMPLVAWCWTYQWLCWRCRSCALHIAVRVIRATVYQLAMLAQMVVVLAWCTNPRKLRNKMQTVQQWAAGIYARLLQHVGIQIAVKPACRKSKHCRSRGHATSNTTNYYSHPTPSTGTVAS